MLLFIDVIVLVVGKFRAVAHFQCSNGAVELVLASEFPPAFVVERSCECIPHSSGEGQGEAANWLVQCCGIHVFHEEPVELLRRFLESNGTEE